MDISPSTLSAYDNLVAASCHGSWLAGVENEVIIVAIIPLDSLLYDIELRRYCTYVTNYLSTLLSLVPAMVAIKLDQATLELQYFNQ